MKVVCDQLVRSGDAYAVEARSDCALLEVSEDVVGCVSAFNQDDRPEAVCLSDIRGFLEMVYGVGAESRYEEASHPNHVHGSLAVSAIIAEPLLHREESEYDNDG